MKSAIEHLTDALVRVKEDLAYEKTCLLVTTNKILSYTVDIESYENAIQDYVLTINRLKESSGTEIPIELLEYELRLVKGHLNDKEGFIKSRTEQLQKINEAIEQYEKRVQEYTFAINFLVASNVS